MASMWAAAHRPERVDRLVVCCTSARLGPPEAWAARAAAVRAGGTEAVADTIVARWFTAPFAALHPDLVAKLRAGIAATGADGYIACCGALERMDLRADIRSIRAPALAVAGADDPSTPPEHLRAIAAAIPGCRLEVVAQAAHLANLEQPEKVTALIANHLGATA
jgi:3-oxoadipate enol-lactonase